MSQQREFATPQMVQIQRMAADLRELGVRVGGVLLVHGSLKALGHVNGGPETVIRGLLEALGPEGTLLLPALSYEHVTPEAPCFDVRRTPSNVGALPEHFRQRPGVRRSVHPTHSVCGVGPLTAALLDDHLRDETPCGPHSPFHRLPHYAGQILMLGCGLRPNTSMHAIEEIVRPPYLLAPPRPYTLTLEDGATLTQIYYPHDFAGYVQRYDRVEPLLEGNGLHRGKVLAATSHLLEAPPLWEAALAALRRDPFHFVERLA